VDRERGACSWSVRRVRVRDSWACSAPRVRGSCS